MSERQKQCATRRLENGNRQSNSQNDYLFTLQKINKLKAIIKFNNIRVGIDVLKSFDILEYFLKIQNGSKMGQKLKR